MLLSYLVEAGRLVPEIKASRFGRLLNKPILKKVARNAGDGKLTRDILESFWPADHECYLLTLGKWGDRSRWARFYNQTSRPGANLVLQLNFSAKHNRPYYKMVKPKEKDLFACSGHPIAGSGYHTLAWARIDMDFQTDEALIEEVQSDWIKLAIIGKSAMTAIENGRNGIDWEGRWIVENIEGDSKNLIKYVTDILNPHAKIWDEAMLAASIWLLKEEIGIKKIYYHTYEYGCIFKGITGHRPPKSLYTTLPKKFCFEETNDAPAFLLNKNNRKIKALMKSRDCRFFRLEF
jgi:hypothetical protein